MDLSDGENKTMLYVEIEQSLKIYFQSDTDYVSIDLVLCQVFGFDCERAIDISVWHIDYKMNED